MTNPTIPPATINKSGTRIVIETNYMPSTDRCQMIFERIALDDGKRGWKISLCWPGIPAFRLTDDQARTLAYGLRTAQGIT